MEKYRYPGTKSFSGQDREIFKGRKRSTDSLYNLLLKKGIIVLYAESGLGKSSLVNAGLIPLFLDSSGDKKYLPVNVRFGPGSKAGKGDLLSSKMLAAFDAVTEKITEQAIPFADRCNDLWHKAKLLQNNGFESLIVFDQAEEIFSYTKDQIESFEQQLYSLTNSYIPSYLDQRINDYIDRYDQSNSDGTQQSGPDPRTAGINFIYQPLDVRILFVIKDEKLAQLNRFSVFFPDILKDTYGLRPLDKDEAMEAITLPAAVVGDFKTAPFSYDPSALEKLEKELCEEDETYDPFSIQVVCSYIERVVVAGKRNVVITAGDIPPKGEVEKGLFSAVWKTLPPEYVRKVPTYKRAIALKFINNGSRIRAYSGVLPDGVLDHLVREGIVRRDHEDNTDYFELAHDRLIKPALDSYSESKEKEKYDARTKKIAIYVGGAILVWALILFGIWKYKKANEDVMLDVITIYNAAREIQHGNLETGFGIYKRFENSDYSKLLSSPSFDNSDVQGRLHFLANNYIASFINDSTGMLWYVSGKDNMRNVGTFNHVSAFEISGKGAAFTVRNDSGIFLFDCLSGNRRPVFAGIPLRGELSFSKQAGYLSLSDADDVSIYSISTGHVYRYKTAFFNREYAENIVYASDSVLCSKQNGWLKYWRKNPGQTTDSEYVLPVPLATTANKEGKLLSFSAAGITLLNLANNSRTVVSHDNYSTYTTAIYETDSIVMLYQFDNAADRYSHLSFYLTSENGGAPSRLTDVGKLALNRDYSRCIFRDKMDNVYLLSLRDKGEKKKAMTFLKSAVAYDISYDGNLVAYVKLLKDSTRTGTNQIARLCLNNLEGNSEKIIDTLIPVPGSDDSTSIYGKYYFRFSANTESIAYLKQKDNSPMLVVRRIADGITLFCSKNHTAVDELTNREFTGNYIHTVNENGEQGVKLLNNKPRNVSYFLKFFKRIDEAEYKLIRNDVLQRLKDKG